MTRHCCSNTSRRHDALSPPQAWVRAHAAAPLPADEGANAALLVAVEAAKRRLSAAEVAEVPLPGDAGGSFTLTSAHAEEAVTPLLDVRARTLQRLRLR